MVAKQISKGIGDKEHQLELCVDSLENASYVLWRHLDHFVNTPSTRQRVGNIFDFFFRIFFRANPEIYCYDRVDLRSFTEVLMKSRRKKLSLGVRSPW